MENKYSPKTQAEIEKILTKIHAFKKFFSINIEYYIDGWAIFLNEKNIYPRRIVIFKSYNNDSFSIKSFEINLNDCRKEENKELYSKINLDTIDKVMKEVKDIIYGKDMMRYTLEKYFNKVLKKT
jgi:hypothetical protein